MNEAKASQPGDVEHDPLWYRDKGEKETGVFSDPSCNASLARQQLFRQRRLPQRNQCLHCRMYVVGRCQQSQPTHYRPRKVSLDGSNPNLYANRAACHLKLSDAAACAADCTKALSLLQPPVHANAPLRLKCHVRRASALELLEDYESGAGRVGLGL